MSRTRQKTVDIFSVCCSYQVTACVCTEGQCFHPAPGWNSLDPLCCPKALRHALRQPLCSALSPRLELLSLLSAQTPQHTRLRPLSTFLLCSYRVCMYTLTCTVVYRGLCFSGGSHVWICQECWQPSGEPPGCGFSPPFAISMKMRLFGLLPRVR